jgi:lipopolysaccharide transport system permease protein
MHLWQYRYLIFQLTRRELVARYRGSFLGIGWSVLYPLLMLGVYTFVFSVVFQAKWGVGIEQGRLGFALNLFIGILTFDLFRETANSSPILVVTNPNYVKKMVFPLEVLPVVTLISALINSGIGVGVLILGLLIVNHAVPWTAFLLPLVWLPPLLFSLGCAYFLASLGVFIRDLASAIGLVTTILFFISPIFYPVSAVPQKFRVFIQINPISLYILQARQVMLWGQFPAWDQYAIGLIISLGICCAGFIWFMKTKRGFADVL